MIYIDSKYAPLAQLDRVADFELTGHLKASREKTLKFQYSYLMEFVAFMIMTDI